jgi:hypothetical protein
MRSTEKTVEVRSAPAPLDSIASGGVRRRFDTVAMPDEQFAIADEPLIDKDRAQLMMTDDQFKVQTPHSRRLTNLKAFTWDDICEIIGSPSSPRYRLIPQNPDRSRNSVAGHQTWLDTLNSKRKS